MSETGQQTSGQAEEPSYQDLVREAYGELPGSSGATEVEGEGAQAKDGKDALQGDGRGSSEAAAELSPEDRARAERVASSMRAERERSEELRAFREKRPLLEKLERALALKTAGKRREAIFEALGPDALDDDTVLDLLAGLGKTEEPLTEERVRKTIAEEAERARAEAERSQSQAWERRYEEARTSFAGSLRAQLLADAKLPQEQQRYASLRRANPDMAAALDHLAEQRSYEGAKPWTPDEALAYLEEDVQAAEERERADREFRARKKNGAGGIRTSGGSTSAERDDRGSASSAAVTSRDMQGRTVTPVRRDGPGPGQTFDDWWEEKLRNIG